MEARKAIITDIFNNATLIEVPFFQRPYVWKEDLWDRLMEDMEFVTKTRKPHFLGSIILKKGREAGSGDLFADCKTVVDGQQRLTTFTIFMKVLSLKKGERTFFDSQFRIMGSDIALRHGKNDVDAFEKVFNMEKVEKIDGVKSRIVEAYNYYIDNIDESKLDIMTIRTNTQFVLINLDADEDEQQIFDTINSLGVNLTTSELLKNYFFSRETIDEYEKKWVPVFEKDDEAKSYWDKEIEVGRVKRALIDVFFDAYFQIFIQNKSYNIENEDKLMYARLDHLAQSYQHFINKYCDGDKGVILDSLKDYAETFQEIFNPDYCNESIPELYGIERLNVVIFGLKNSTLIPYVLYVKKNVMDQVEVSRICGILESYILRRIIVRATTKNYNNLFLNFISGEILDSKTLTDRLKQSQDNTNFIPSNDEIKEGFHKSNIYNLQAKGILYLIESGMKTSKDSVKLLGFNSYSLEHLMPKKWRNNWDKCATKELEDERDSKLRTMGNLAIITQSLNASIRDSDWNTKKKGKNGKEGLEKYAAGLETLRATLEKDVWNEDEIEARAEFLYKEALTIWII